MAAALAAALWTATLVVGELWSASARCKNLRERLRARAHTNRGVLRRIIGRPKRDYLRRMRARTSANTTNFEVTI